MSAKIQLTDSTGVRELAPADFPLAVAASPTGGLQWIAPEDSDHAMLFLDLQEQGLLATPSPGFHHVRINGEPLTGPAILKSDDTLETGSHRIVFTSKNNGDFRLEVRGPQDAEVITPLPFRPGQDAPRSVLTRLSPLSIAIAALFLVLCAAVWFLLTARSVELLGQPAPDIIEIDSGGFSLELGGRFLMRPGNYRVSMRKQGYQPLSADLQVGDEQNQEFRFTLEKLPGLLVVNTQPIDGASVFVDGIQAGVTPLPPFEVAAGVHTLSVQAPRFQPFEQEVDIEGMGQTRVVDLTLVPGWADVTLDSQPPGAQILIDGVEAGLTPASIPIMAGSHDIELSLEGHKSWTRQLEVIANEPIVLESVKLVSADGLIQLRTNPTGARVTVDGRYQGQTPLDLALAPGGRYLVKLGKVGYQTVSRTVTVASGKGQRLQIDLPAFVGEIRILSNPGNAKVYLDGRELGVTGQSFALPALPQKLELRKPGYAPYTLTVTPRPGFAQEVEATLQTVEQARVASIPRIIKSSAGDELRLLPQGRFQMGTSRREQGRRSNESLRQAEISRRYYLSTREVTNAQFREFRGQHNSGSFKDLDLNRDEYPVSGVSWEAAVEYCNWLSQRDGLPEAYLKQGDTWRLVTPANQGYRLPTEAEWAWAARYQGGVGELGFPWGDSMPPESGSGNFADITAKKVLSLYMEDYNDGYAVAAPVAKFKANALGLHDLGGNVAEWIHDYYQTYPGAAQKMFTDPMGPQSGEMHVIRGSSWRQGSLSELRFAYRDFDKQARPDLGFRIARYAE